MRLLQTMPYERKATIKFSPSRLCAVAHAALAQRNKPAFRLSFTNKATHDWKLPCPRTTPASRSIYGATMSAPSVTSSCRRDCHRKSRTAMSRVQYPKGIAPWVAYRKAHFKDLPWPTNGGMPLRGIPPYDLIPIPIHNVPDETDGFFRLARRVRSQ